jgi:hypothetical protein
MPFKEAIAIRGLGEVEYSKQNIKKCEQLFLEAIAIFQKLGASFELQKTSLEYAKMLSQNSPIIAEFIAKSIIFDSGAKYYKEVIIDSYLLLGDISVKRRKEYLYYLEGLKVSEFNPKIYVRICYRLIFRMQKMKKKTLIKFIHSLKEQNQDYYFGSFLEILNLKIQGKEYSTDGLPKSLSYELEKFNIAY